MAKGNAQRTLGQSDELAKLARYSPMEGEEERDEGSAR
jgi:hypothetical protein